MKKIAKKILLSTLVLCVFIVPIMLPFTSTQAQQLEQIQTPEALADETALPSCLTLGGGSVLGCVGQLFYWAGWWPTYWFAARTGSFLDFFVFYSINSNTYRGVPIPDGEGGSTNFIQEGWEIVRDLSNIFFIFSLIYIGLSFVVGNFIGGTEPKRLLIYVIVMALLINFSLFFTKIVVDAGNILARTLYNQINLVGKSVDNTELTNTDGVKSIGMMIISLANPQRLMLSQFTDIPISTNYNAGDRNATAFLMITIGSIVLNVALIYVFVSMALYFVGRIVGIYFAMIFSPIAFASLAFPKGSSIGFIGFGSWISNLVKSSFMPAIFLFFMYLTIKFLSIGIPINPNIGSGNYTADVFMSIMIPFALVIAFLVYGKSISQKMSGEIAQKATAMLTKGAQLAAGAGLTIAGGAAVVATGAVAGGAMAAGRGIVNAKFGAKGASIAGGLKNWSNSNSLIKRTLGKSALRAGKKLDSVSTDPRKSKLAKLATSTIINPVARAAGVSVNTKWVDSVGAGNVLRSRDDAVKARADRAKKEAEEDVERNTLSGIQAEEYKRQAQAHNDNLDKTEAAKYEAAKASAKQTFLGQAHIKAQMDKMTELEKIKFMKEWEANFDKNYATLNPGLSVSKYKRMDSLEEYNRQALRLAQALAKERARLSQTTSGQKANMYEAYQLENRTASDAKLQERRQNLLKEQGSYLAKIVSLLDAQGSSIKTLEQLKESLRSDPEKAEAELQKAFENLKDQVRQSKVDLEAAQLVFKKNPKDTTARNRYVDALKDNQLAEENLQNLSNAFARINNYEQQIADSYK